MNARSSKVRPIPSYPGLEVISERVVWNGRYPLQRVRFRRRRFDGAEGGEQEWELWRRGAGVAMLPYDPWADRVALIEQFRLGALAAGLKAVMTECPAGLLEGAEDPVAAAHRELREETGLETDRLERIGRYILAQGGSDETLTLFCARVALPETGGIAHHGLTQEHEDIRLLVLPATEALAMLDDGRIENAPAGLCLGWLSRHRARLRSEWSRS